MQLINMSLKMGNIPEQLKIAKIRLLFKDKDKMR